MEEETKKKPELVKDAFPNSFRGGEIPTECVLCGKWNDESCNTCVILNPQFDGV